MAKAYLISESAINNQRDINAIVRAGFRRRRPTQKRRRFRSGTPGARFARAMATSTIPAASNYDGNAKTVEPGTATSGVTLMDWKTDVAGETEFPLTELEAVQESDGSDPPQDVDAVRFAVNASGTEIRGSVAAPVLLFGLLETVSSSNGSEEVFYVTSVMDFAALPGHIENGDRTDDARSPFSYGDERTYQLDRDEC